MADYDVRAKLTLDSSKAAAGAKRAGQSVKALGQSIKGANSMAGGLLRNMLAIGAAYIGFNAIKSITTSLIGTTLEYTATLEKTKIGLTSVLAAVEASTWQEATKTTGEVFNNIRKMSLQSPAGPLEMFKIFQGIVGPIRNAGFELEKVEKITKNTVLASSALGIDYEQAQRDISLMARGAAGMDVKTFSLLRSMGLIVETTEEWNRQLTAAERIEKLDEALQGFEKSGEAFAKSYSGATQVFKGLVNELKRAAFQPVLDMLAGRLVIINAYLTENQVRLESLFASWGSRFAVVLESTMDKTQQVFTFIINNWDRIIEKMNKAVELAKKYAPAAAAAAVARPVLGTALQAGGAAIVAGGGIMGAFGGGGAAAGAGGAAAGGAGAAAASVGAGAAASAAAVALAVLAAALLLVASTVTVARTHWGLLTSWFEGDFARVAKMAVWIWDEAKVALGTAMKSIGTFMLIMLVPAFKALMIALQAVMGVLFFVLRLFNDLVDLITGAFTWAWEGLIATLEWVMETSDGFVSILQLMVGALGDAGAAVAWFLEKLKFGDDTKLTQLADVAVKQGLQVGAVMPFMSMGMATTGETKKKTRGTPGARGGTTMNVNKMIIKQEFKGKHDPDRILTMMLRDITKQAESRVSSRFTPALSR